MVSNSLPTSFANVNQFLTFSEPKADFLLPDDKGVGGLTDVSKVLLAVGVSDSLIVLLLTDSV